MTPYLQEVLGENLAKKMIKIYIKNMEYIQEESLPPEHEYQLRIGTWNEIQRQIKHTLIREHIKNMEYRGNNNKNFI
jgi:hypothetical protein